MSESIDERIKRYVLDGGDADLQRLLAISDLTAGRVRDALAHVGIEPGWRALDCGCGPLGALAVMADMVGPAGRAVGVDFSDAAVRRARSVAAMLAIDNVEAHVGDVHDLGADELGGPFDVAYTRCFLMHQPDPARTLERIASLVRPGGWIVAHEPLRSPPPRSSPALEALARAWWLLHDVAEHLGVPHDSVDALPLHARSASGCMRARRRRRAIARSPAAWPGPARSTRSCASCAPPPTTATRG